MRFWLKTALYRWTPGGYGRYRLLRRLKDPAYDHARDRHRVRELHNATTGWSTTVSDGLRTRRYGSYDEYVTHQRQKLEEILKVGGELLANRVVSAHRVRFFRRFRILNGRVPRSAAILCLGARLGTEVEVLRDMGYRNAVGIDLNPGPDNPFVRAGDFQELEAADDSIDVVYSNCVDHSFDLDGFFAEHVRVLTPGGYALYDFPAKSDESTSPFETVVWSDDALVLGQMEAHFGAVVERGRDDFWEWLLLRCPS